MKKKILIKNAEIWTSDRNNPWAESLIIDGDKIEFAGDLSTASNLFDGGRIVDAGGKMIIPAFIDSHIHITSTALSMQLLWFHRRQFKTFEELMEVVRDYAEEHPKEEVPFINSYSCPSECIDAEGVNRYLMDKYVSDRPVLVMDVNFHRSIVNSRMLELMEVDKNTPYDNTTSMNYERFEDNTPTGIILEHAHEFNGDIDKMYKNLNWWPPKENDPELLADFIDRVTDYGITGLHEGFTESELILQGLSELEKQGRLKQYVHCMPMMKKAEELEDAIIRVKGWQKKYRSEYIYVNSIKIFLDGTLELGTYAALDEFVCEPGNYGTLNFSEEELTHIFERINQEGINMQIHLVGDRAFRTALNAKEAAAKNENAAGREFRSLICLMHCELTNPNDRKRAGELGITVNVNPGWCSGIFGQGAEKYMGEEKFKSLYSYNEIIRSGARVCFSSDITDEGGFEVANPFYGMEVAHRRMDEIFVGDKQREPAEECIALEDLLYGYTINNAAEMGIACKAGSLEAGKKANLCILSDNIFRVPAGKIKEIKCDTVMFEGEILKGRL